jgi:hypothetical protein
MYYCSKHHEAGFCKGCFDEAAQKVFEQLNTSTNTASHEIAACHKCDDMSAKVGYALQEYKFCPYCGRQLQA